MSEAIDEEWSGVAPVRVGRVPKGIGTPPCFVCVTQDEQPLLRVDVYSLGPDCIAFRKALIWHDYLVVGFGSHIHAISLTDNSSITIPLAEYFGELYPTQNYLLIASCSRLFRMEQDRSILWTSDQLGIDGVIVHRAESPTIRGKGEWDPPGGGRNFAVSAEDGSITSCA